MNRRWWILFLLFLAITINMLDRQVLALVAPVLSDQFHLTNTDYSYILLFFLLGMTLGQVPVGLALDRKGVRWGFPVITICWSIVNMAHGLARSVVQFCGLRFLLGVSECGTYSGGVKVIGQWFPPNERTFASGLFNSGSLAGAIIAPPLIVWIIEHYGWHAAFLLPGAIGMLWVIPWLKIYRPAAASIDRGSGALAASSPPAPPIRTLLRQPPVWGVILMRAFGGPVTHFYWYWLPLYLKNARGMSLEEIGVFATLPYIFGGVGNIGGGWLSSALLRRGWSVNAARKSVVALGVTLCLAAVFVPLVHSSAAALILICVATAGINAVAATQIGILADLFPQAVLARISGLTGVGDGVMSMTMMFLTGVVVDHFSYLPVFVGAAILPILLFCSLMILVGRIRPLSFA